MIRAIQALSVADLREIGSALRSSRLSPPFTGPALKTFCSARNEEAVAGEMQQLAEEVVRPEHLALMLEGLAQARSGPGGLADPVDLVWSGPEVPGIANRDTGVVVRELFTNARDSVLVAGYAVHQGRE